MSVPIDDLDPNAPSTRYEFTFSNARSPNSGRTENTTGTSGTTRAIRGSYSSSPRSILVFAVGTACAVACGAGDPDPAGVSGERPGGAPADEAPRPGRDGGAPSDGDAGGDAITPGDPPDASVDAPADAPRPFCTTPLTTDLMVAELGKAYHVTKNFGFRGDTPTAPTRSPLEVYEDGNLLGPGHSLHADIRSLAGGRFSHWHNGLYFSASDGSDPRSNGRTYTIRGPCHVPRQLDLEQLATSSTGYATFQSHLQRMVSNAHGIFVSYLAAELPDGRLVHRLVRSTDSGKTFQLIHEGTNKTKAPAVETDEAGNVYIFYSEDYDDSSKPALFYRFDAAAGFTNPVSATIPQGSAGKFAALYDPIRQRFYYFTFWDSPHPNFYTVDKNGQVLAQTSLTSPGAFARLQYPHLRRDGARIYAAWTTQHLAASTPAYRSIHYMFSDDGGVSWKTPAGNVTIPVVGDDSGPIPQIVLGDELDPSTWLSSFFARGSSAHFFYYASAPIDRQHYVRVDTTTGGRTIDRYPQWNANGVSIATLDGFFAAGDASLPLFAVGRDTQNRIGVIASDDDGQTWLDYAVSAPIQAGYGIYSIGGAREPGPDGYIVGSFTELDNDGTDHVVRFFRVKAEQWE